MWPVNYAWGRGRKGSENNSKHLIPERMVKGELLDHHRLASSTATSSSTTPTTNTMGGAWRGPLLISDSLQRFPPPLYNVRVQCAFREKGPALS